MNTTEQSKITVEVSVKAPFKKVWECFTEPSHIVKWNFASDDWCTPKAENDLRDGGKLKYRMEAKDGSAAFDFEGSFTKIEEYKLIAYQIADGRNVEITFTENENGTLVTETFEAENTNSLELQRQGWQAILDNFKKHVEWLLEKVRINFEIEINAPASVVYSTMIEDKSYREWTSAFNPGSYFKGTWEKGSKILFIGVDGQGNEGGMVSRIKENIPNEYISIEHIGLLYGNEEITSGPEVEGWAGAFENYTFIDKVNTTLLKVELDANNEFNEYFSETWPKSLEILKSICEK
jgi:uncharacterized protein YndB with AHSA1/START domain